MEKLYERLESLGYDTAGLRRAEAAGCNRDALRDYVLYLIAVYDDRHEYVD